MNALGLMRLRRFISEHKLASILAVGILVRVVLMPISAHPFDVYCWYNTSMSILRNGPLSVQSFPPLWSHYMLIPVAYVYDLLARVFPASVGAIPMASLPTALNFYPSYNIEYVPGLLFNSVVKFPFLISDVLVTLLLYKTVEAVTKSKKLAEKAALLWFLNPFLIWISAVWGMWDTLPVLFSLAAFFLLLKKRPAFSAVCLSLGVATKLYPVLFLFPIAVYFLKSSSAGEKWRNCVKFYSVFAVVSTLLILPDINVVANFVNSFFVPNSAVVSVAVANPVVEPVGFGLTYWSLYLLNRLINLPVTAGFIYLVSIVSVVLVVFSLFLAYWKTSKLSFEKPAYDLVTGMLFATVALFLSFRIIAEQFFVWALPFLVILCVGGRTRRAFYWGASFVALLYSVLNCPFPFFFLPLSPWLTSSLLAMVYTIWGFESVRIVLLAVLGCLFSLLMLVIVMKLKRASPK